MKKKWAIKKTEKTPAKNSFGKLIAWIENNRKKMLYITFAGAAVLILASYFALRNKRLNTKSWEEFSTLHQKITETQNSQKRQTYLKEIDEFVKKYPNRAAGAYASMFKGEILYENAKYQKAAQIYRQITLNKKFKKYIPLAFNSLLYCYLAQNKEPEFLETADNFVKLYPNHLLTPQVYAQMADIYQVKGETEKASEIYQKLSAYFAQSPWGRSAKMMLEQKTGDEKTNNHK